MSAPPLAGLRLEIERIDALILALIVERVAVAREIGRVKADEGLAVTDPAREAAVVARAAGVARESGIAEEEMRTLYWQLIAMCRREQGG